jgi:hypothetical protein
MTAPSTKDCGVEQAAQAIVKLINSRPSSPRHDEIAAIIRRLVVTASAPAGRSNRDALDREYGPDLTKRAP